MTLSGATNDSEPGAMIGVGVTAPLMSPYTSSSSAAPTYTIPFAMVGTEKRTAGPATSRAASVALEYSVVDTLLASCARRMAGPPVAQASASIFHTMPCAVPLAEIDGVEPGNANCSLEVTGGDLSNPFTMGNCFKLSYCPQ